MIEPIKLNEFGEVLEGYLDSKVKEEGELSNCIGSHAVCHGWVDIKAISQTHNAIICRSCNLRIPVPKRIKTYGDLRRHFSKANG